MVSSAVKGGFMVALCMQNVVYTLLRRYAVGVQRDGFSPSSVLLGGELMKFAVSAAKVSPQIGHAALLQRNRVMLVPAIVFWAQNLLSYVSLQRIDATAFTVCAQMKILSTAVAGVLMLNRRLCWRKWRALVLLCLAVIDVSFHSMPAEARQSRTDSRLEYAVGLGAVLLEVALSGFVNVYFERVLKSLDEGVEYTVWDRNFQLAAWSILLYCPIALRDRPPGEGLLFGWTYRTVLLAALGAGGGILVALVTKHTDAIMKTFAAAGAIVVTAVVGIVAMGQPATVGVCVGCAAAVLALFNYVEPDSEPPPPPPPPQDPAPPELPQPPGGAGAVANGHGAQAQLQQPAAKRSGLVGRRPQADLEAPAQRAVPTPSPLPHSRSPSL
eukprot:TRINITY_DN35286_c1_g1_i1.p2 TRINITY_DN35286_c1_g1~~TRINITY_DN35286_c1_g1_i1.p2  ORF type:complete len:384 (+),score=126.48 TRINITY_DN35286_c1_g1_i1:83-1234(+)